jgi:hypothetical protein
VKTKGKIIQFQIPPKASAPEARFSTVALYAAAA